MILDYFGLDEDITALEAQLAMVEPPQRPGLLAALAWYLRQRDTQRALSLCDEADALLAADACLEPACRRAMEARLTLVRGEARYLLGDPEDAAVLMTSARAAFEGVGDLVGAGDACMQQAIVAEMRGEAKPKRVDAQALYREAGDVRRQRIAELSLAVSQACRAPDAAVQQWGALIREARAVGRPAEAVFAEQFDAIFHYRRADLGRAALHFELGCELATSVGQVRWAIIAASNACAAFGDLGDLAQGLEWAEYSLKLARRAGWPATLAGTLCETAETLRELGRHRLAHDLLNEAVKVLAPHRQSRNWTIACRYLGNLLLDEGNEEEALHWFTVAEQAGRLIDAAVVGQSLRGRAQALSRLRRPAEAVAAIEECLAVCASTDDRVTRANALCTYAEIARAHDLPPAPGATAASAPIHYMEAALAAVGAIQGFMLNPAWLSQLSRDYEAAGDLACALDCERRAATALEARHTKKATNLASALQVRHETERVRAEAAHHQALAEAETRRADAAAAANEAKSAFLANMSHELRSPLNAMLGFTRLLLRDPALDSRHEDLAIVMRSGEHLYTLINQVLDMSKIEAGRATLVETECDLHALLEELREMFAVTARAKGVDLNVDCDAAVPQHVRADAVKLRQVLINLLGNALQFTPHGRVELSVSAPSGALGFTVTDTGVGIAPDELAQLGRAFVQARAGQRAAEGTGLGLAISRGFVELMGGELRLASVPGQGTRAHFAVPLQPVATATALVSRAAPTQRVIGLAPHTPAQRVLVVDDRPEGRLLVMRLLAPLGFDVRDAADGEEALAVWRAWSPQLVLMDMRMPVMDGREATRRIKADPRGRDTVVIALTASSFEEEREQILAAGCDDFLRKPFQENMLLEMMARHLKLEYVREDTTPAVSPQPDAQRLARLPQPVREQLLAALDRLDVQAVEQAIEAVREHDTGCAAALAPLARHFQYERIRALTAGVP